MSDQRPSGDPRSPEAQEAIRLMEEMEKERREQEMRLRDTVYPDEPARRRKKPRRNRSGKPGKRGGGRGHIIQIIVVIVLLLVIIVLGAAIYRIRSGSRVRMDAHTYFMNKTPSNEDGTINSLQDDELAVVMQDDVIAPRARLIDEHVYLNYDMVCDYLTTRFYWDEPENRMLYTTATQTWSIPVNSADYTKGNEAASFDQVIVWSDERGLYLSSDFVSTVVNMTCELFADTQHILITYQWGTRETGTASRRAKVRWSPDRKSDYVTELSKGDLVYILQRTDVADGEEAADGYVRVLTPDAFIGYVTEKSLKDLTSTETSHEFEEAVYTHLRSDERINLTWDQVTTQDGNSGLESRIENMTGVNVISPTWFSLSDNEGNFTSIADSSYVRTAHNHGLQVWGLVSNFSPDMSTTTLMASTDARLNLVGNLIGAALSCGMDGINIDFESIQEAAGPSFVQFMRELSVSCRANNLVLSVDLPVTTSYNQYYDRKELGTVIDYLIIMGYDEHYAGSEAGSVASLSFEENGIKGTLESASPDAVISAVPFYTRLWYSTTDADGNESVWSDELGMVTAATTLRTYDVGTTWDEQTQQNYAKWTLDNGVQCQIWMEDADSLALKAALVKKYDLGGIASWYLGAASDTIWEVLSSNIT